MMKELILAVVLVITFAGEGLDAADCCGSYTDALGQYHESELCSDYCCFNVGVDFKVCCSDPDRQIPATKNQNDVCVQNWLREHIWVPIVGGIVGLIILICICTCCCCCGCCACFRKNPRPVIVHTAASPSTTVAMANTTTYNQNPAHVGYNQ